MKKKLSWKPRLRGKIYCSSACGHRCTKHDYDDAVKNAKALAKKLGYGWKTRVWENMGWHYSVSNGPISLSGYGPYYGSRGASYLCLIDNNMETRHGGCQDWTTYRRRSPVNPFRAVRVEARSAIRYIEMLVKVMGKLKQILKDMKEAEKCAKKKNRRFGSQRSR
jgi:hypothetical protein